MGIRQHKHKLSGVKSPRPPDYQLAKEWKEDHENESAVHHHNPTMAVQLHLDQSIDKNGKKTYLFQKRLGVDLNKEPVAVTSKKVKTDVEDDNPFINNDSSSSSTAQDSFIFASKSQNLDGISPGQEEQDRINCHGSRRRRSQEAHTGILLFARDIRNKLLAVLSAQKEKDKKFGKDFMSSISLNNIIDLSNDKVSEKVYKSLDERQNEWLHIVLKQRSWKQTDEFKKYIYQFTEDVCDRTTIPYLVHKSFITPIESFNSYRHEGHDIAQRILTHFSERLEEPTRSENKSLDYERTYSIDTTVYIMNRSFRMHQDVVELDRVNNPHTKNHKMNGLVKMIKTKQNQAVILFEFSYGRRASESKEDGDEYLIHPLPSIYILQTFTIIKIPVSFDDFEQSAKIIVDLMNLQADVLSTIKSMNKVVTRPKNINTTSVQNTPEKNKKVERPSSPKSPCPGGSPSELPSLIYKLL
ncbi:5329_t:CDS:2, partial [Gigaspora margarita]